MANPPQIPARQLDLGPASFFQAGPESPVGNQVRVKPGFLYSGARGIFDRYTAGDQLTGGFSSVALGFQRYDLVYLDSTGAVVVLPGTAVLAGSPVFQGAPGFTGGPALPDNAVPVAYIFIDEVLPTVPSISQSDITNIPGLFHVARDLDGYFVDKGLIGAPPTGASDVVTGSFVGETPGGSSTAAGVITDPPANMVHLLDQKRDEIIHAATSSRIYGRITHAAGVWTLSYFYTDALGVETAVAAIETDTTLGGGLTNVRMVGVPRVYSRNDSARPLFASPEVQISDQVAGDIPDASTTVKGKVELATSVETTAGLALQASDTRLPTQNENDALQGAATGGAPTNANRFVVDDDSRFAGVFPPSYFHGTAVALGAPARVLWTPVEATADITVDGAGIITFTYGGGGTRKYRVRFDVTKAGGGAATVQIRKPNASTVRAQADDAGTANATIGQEAIISVVSGDTLDVFFSAGAISATAENNTVSIERIA